MNYHMKVLFFKDNFGNVFCFDGIILRSEKKIAFENYKFFKKMIFSKNLSYLVF